METFGERDACGVVVERRGVAGHRRALLAAEARNGEPRRIGAPRGPEPQREHSPDHRPAKRSHDARLLTQVLGESHA
jgi:hypothetical protein